MLVLQTCCLEEEVVPEVLDLVPTMLAEDLAIPREAPSMATCPLPMMYV